MPTRVLDESSPWVATLRRPTANSLDVRLTDLLGFFVCTCSDADLKTQLREASIETPVEKMLSLMMAAFDGSAPDPSMHAFHVRRDGGDARLDWLIKDDPKLTFRCVADPNPATRLRDEVMLPLMRVTEQLHRLVPAGSEWTAAPQASMPLPAFHSPLLARVFHHAGQAPGDTVAAPSESEPQRASGNPEPSAPLPPPTPPRAAAASQSQPQNGLSPESLEEVRKRKAKDERERKASKAKAAKH